MSVEPETEFRTEMDIPVEILITCEECLGAAIDTASRYITADKPELTAIFTSQEVTTSFATENTQTVPPYIIIIINTIIIRNTLRN